MEKFLNIKLINKQKKNLVLPLNLFLRREQNTFIFSLLVRIRLDQNIMDQNIMDQNIMDQNQT